MTRPFAMDLRLRVVAAVTVGGMSWCGAAAHFGVAFSTAIKWLDRVRSTGIAAPQMGGYKPRAIAGAHREWLLQCCREADFTLRGLVAELAARELKVDHRSVWTFVHDEKLS